MISDEVLKSESRGNGRLLAARVVYQKLPRYGRCRIVGQIHPEQDTRQGKNSAWTYKQETFHLGITLAGLAAVSPIRAPGVVPLRLICAIVRSAGTIAGSAMNRVAELFNLSTSVVVLFDSTHDGLTDGSQWL